MGYFKIIAVGLFWLLKTLTSPSGWWMLIILIIAALYKPARGYANRLLEVDDQKVYALLGGKSADRTISGYVGYMSLHGYAECKQAEKVINFIFFWQPNHCQEAIDWDEYK